VNGGAVAYLTHSQYGRNGNEITINNSSSYITGNAGGSVSAGETSGITNEYNTTAGMLASTTGNITGIYDLSGGAFEYTAAWDTNSTSSNISSYGSSFASQGGTSTKYATAYHNGTTSYEPTSSRCILGDATYEVNVNPGSASRAWFNDYSYCVYSAVPFFERGGYYGASTYAGVFYSNDTYANSDTYISFRVVVPGGEIKDTIAPTINSLITTNAGGDGFTVSIDASDNVGGVGLAETDTYTIYYKKKNETEYQTITTSENVYTLTGLTPEITTSQVNAPSVKDGMNPVIWLDLNGDGTIDEATEEIVKYTDLTTKTINPKWIENNGDSQWYYYNSPNGDYDVYVTAVDKVGNVSTNSPTVQETLKNVDHKTSHFGNVKMEDGSYFVWIPRYAYKLTKAPSTEPSVTNAGAIDVKFVEGTSNKAYDGTICTITKSNADGTPNNIDSTTQYIVHPAFCEDVNMGGYAQDLEGIWVAKYESSQETSTDGTNWTATKTTDSNVGNVLTTKAGNTSSTKIRVVSKPNVTSWRNGYIGTFYTNGLYYNRTLDSHMMKNSEWGATAYLTHSQYGRNGNEISRNDSSGYYTGRSKGSPIANGSSEQGTYQYNETGGMLASTSGNIYGIYDLSGGALEYIAAWDTKAEDQYNCISICGNSFARKLGTSTPYATAYYNGMTSSGTGYRNPTSSKCILGDAIYEVNVEPGGSNYAWFNDFSYCAYSDTPFFERGGIYSDDAGNGVRISECTIHMAPMVIFTIAIRSVLFYLAET